MVITEAEIRKVYETAPDNIKEYINSDDVYNAFYEIRTAHNLHLDHAGNLANSINAVILGIKPFEELPQLLREGLQGLDDATRDKVLKDVNDKIFVPLRNLSKKHAEEVLKPELARPSIRNIEIKLGSAPEVAVPPIVKPVTPLAPQTIQTATVAPTPSTTPAATQPPIMSVVEQKMGTITAPSSAKAVEDKPPSAPPRYHGADPYKEPIE